MSMKQKKMSFRNIFIVMAEEGLLYPSNKDEALHLFSHLINVSNQ